MVEQAMADSPENVSEETEAGDYLDEEE